MSVVTRKRKSSASITLVLISASALNACGQSSSTPDTLRQDMYASQADCAKDWGSDPSKCQARTTRTGSGSSYTHYYGPSYRSGDYGSARSFHGVGSNTEARPGSSAMGTTHVSRSGFGSSASSHSSSSGAHASSSS